MKFGNALKEHAMDIGFDLAGVAPISAWADLEFSRQWVERGFGGEMDYLSNPKRHDPRSVLPSAQSVVCVGLVYNAPLPYSVELQEPDVRGKKAGARPDAGRVSNFEFQVSSANSGENAPDALDKGRRTRDEAPRAWISRYAWGRDYHEVMREKLERLRAAIEALAPDSRSSGKVETRVFVDTGPIVERAFARLSGIGWMGKNTCLINQEKGSWFFLGVILTNLALEPDLPEPDRCGSCTRCLEACPTGALVEPYVMDATRCIAYFNIELKGSIPAEFRKAIGANVFGCDICQDVCPWNGRSSGEWQVASDEPKGGGSIEAAPTGLESPAPKGRYNIAQGASPGGKGAIELAKSISLSPAGGKGRGEWARTTRHAATTARPEFQPLVLTIPIPDSRTPIPRSPAPCPPSRAPGPFSLFNPPLEPLASMSEADFRRAFAKSPIKRVKYRGWLRNLCVAMGNSGNARFLPRLQELAAHPDSIVCEHAEWALEKIL